MISLIILSFDLTNTIINYMSMENIKYLADIAQSLVIIGATIFTARWTFKTFAHAEKIKELKEIKILIIDYFYKMQIFCAQRRDNQTPDDKEIAEKLSLLGIHNRLSILSQVNLYTKLSVRQDIQKVVGSWLTNGDRIKAMQGRKTNEEREKAWKEFEAEYIVVKKLIDDVANNLLF